MEIKQFCLVYVSVKYVGFGNRYSVAYLRSAIWFCADEITYTPKLFRRAYFHQWLKKTWCDFHARDECNTPTTPREWQAPFGHWLQGTPVLVLLETSRGLYLKTGWGITISSSTHWCMYMTNNNSIYFIYLPESLPQWRPWILRCHLTLLQPKM